jgi:hypothetical protein
LEKTENVRNKYNSEITGEVQIAKTLLDLIEEKRSQIYNSQMYSSKNKQNVLYNSPLTRKFHLCSSTTSIFSGISTFFDPRISVINPSTALHCAIKTARYNKPLLRNANNEINFVLNSLFSSFPSSLTPSLVLQTKQLIFQRLYSSDKDKLFTFDELRTLFLYTGAFLSNRGEIMMEKIDVHFWEKKEVFVNDKGVRIIGDIPSDYVLPNGERRFSSSISSLNSNSNSGEDIFSGFLVVGDIHGNLDSLLHVLDLIDKMMLLPKDEAKVVFLGDLIDRGDNQVIIIIFYCVFKIFFRLRYWF